MDTATELINDGWDYIKDHGWMIQTFVAVLVTVIASALSRIVFNKLEHLTKSSNNVWDDMLVLSARKPLQYLIWLIGITWALSITKNVSQAPIFDAVDSIQSVGVISLLAWFLVRFIKQMEITLQKPEKVNNPLDPTTASALGKLLRLSIIITAVLVILQTLGFSISGVLAFGGIGGIAVGFAAKDLLANFFGGLMIYLDRPFAVGDWVRSPDKNIEGTVENIGWRLTRIRTFDKRPLYVPNATFTSISVENPSRMSHRRIYETIGIRYNDVKHGKAIVDSVKSMLQAHEDISNEQTLIVNINQFAPSSIDFFIYCFTHTTDWVKYHTVKEDVLLKIADIIESNGAEIAYPTQTLHIDHINNAGADN